jgi:succinoglycan biosynthesis transport protein ExoP
VGFGALRELLDRGFRTREQVRSVLDAECLAMVPLLTSSHSHKTNGPTKLLGYAVSAARGSSRRSIYSTPAVMRTIIDAPSSPYAEAVRSIKLTVDLNNKDTSTRVLGLTSCLPSEGKSSLAAAMATLIAHGGARVLLVDCDIRNPSLSRALAPDAAAGLLDVISGKASLTDAVWGDVNTKLAFLPAVGGQPPANAAEILASDAAKSLFETLKLGYDYVIVDSAPLVAGMDVRATSTLVDSYLLVVEWGATKIDAVQYALRNAPGVQQNIAGVVLNKVDLNAMGRYDSYGSAYYYGESCRTGLMN